MIAETTAKRQRDLFDICQNKHGGDPESVAAHAAGDKLRDRAVALEFIRLRGQTGATADEFAEHLGRQLNQVSGRFTELKRDGQIVASGAKRPTRSGSAAKVYIAK